MITKTLSSKTDINGYSQVLFYIQEGRGLRLRMKSGVYVPKEFWNVKKECLTIPRKISADTVKELQLLREELEDVEKKTLRVIEIYGKENITKSFLKTTLSLIKNVNGKITRELVDGLTIEEDDQEDKTPEINIYEVADKFMQRDLSVGRLRQYHVIFRCMCRYAFFRNKIAGNEFNWNIETTNRTDIEDFFDYLSKEHLYRVRYDKLYNKEKHMYPEILKPKYNQEEQIKERGENRLIGMRKAIKAFWNWMIKSQITTNNPFIGVEIGVEKYGTPYYLTIEERNKVACADLSGNKSLETQRDIFIFQCLTGCRVGDLMKLTCRNVVDGVLTYVPHKTKDEDNSFTVRVPLSESALALIEKYKGVKGVKLFPFIAEQNYNDAIKTILQRCKIDRMVSVRNPKTGENEMKPISEVASSHMARRTFIGSAYKKVKDPSLISKMSGHSERSRAFARYRDTDLEDLKDVIDLIQ